MGVRMITSGALPTRIWDLQASKELGQVARATIVTRTFTKGLGLNDAAHRAYSPKGPITISFVSETARRLKPKGGLPAYGRGHPRRLLTKTGRSTKASGWKITGRRYENYGAYKASSKKTGTGQAAVDLTLSGQLQREFVVKTTELARVEIGLTGEATVYGTHVHAARPWIGISPADQKVISAALNDPSFVGPTGQYRGIVARAMDRSRLKREAASTPAGPR